MAYSLNVTNDAGQVTQFRRESEDATNKLKWAVETGDYSSAHQQLNSLNTTDSYFGGSPIRIDENTGLIQTPNKFGDDATAALKSWGATDAEIEQIYAAPVPAKSKHWQQ
jgi:hypothetical protein